MPTTKITERNLDEKFLQSLYTTDNPPTASDVGAVAESDLATAIQSLIDSGVVEVGAVKSSQTVTATLNVKNSGGDGVSGSKNLTISNVNPANCIVQIAAKGDFALGHTAVFFNSSTSIELFWNAEYYGSYTVQIRILELT